MKTFQWLSAKDYQNQLSQTQWREILASYSFAILPLLFFIEQPLGYLLILAILSKWISLWYGGQKLTLFSLLIILPLGLFLLITHLKQIGITYSFVALLALMSTCKLLESRNQRDSQILFLSSQTLTLCFLMYSQSIPLFLYLLFVIALSYHTLIRISQRHSRITALSSWKSLIKLILIALPLTAILFFTFPRISPLWGLPRPNQQAITGLPNQMELGDIGRLAQSNEIAYRVQFNDTTPNSNQLYWRGPILWTYTGKQWLQRGADNWLTPESLQYDQKSTHRYTLIPAKPDLEWLPTLDMSIKYPAQIHHIGYAHQLRMPQFKNQSEARISLTAATHYRLGAQTLNNRDRANATQLPKNLDLNQTRTLAQQLYQQGGKTTAGFAQAFMNYIRNNEYYYTLEPYPGSGDVETFLFNTHTGFCEHYANAMAIAARTLSIPARIVIGYQGGEINPLTGELVVREENAHAWVELWEEEHGWTRYDPTAAVAPYRIENARLSHEQLSGTDSRSWGSRMAEQYSIAAWMRNALDATQTFWQNWVVNLNSEQQTSLLGKLGLSNYSKNILFLLGAGIIASILALLWYIYQRQQKTYTDELNRAAEKLIAKLGKQGLIRREHESLADFLRRMVEEHRSPNPKQWQQTATAYETARYRNPNHSPTAIKMIRSLSIK